MKIKQILARRWAKICAGVIVALALFFLLLPFGIKYYLADWLKKNGAENAVIEKLWFNPFVGRVTMGGMDVQLGGQSILHNASMVLDLGITSLFNHDIRVEKAEYHDFSIDLEQFKDGSWRFGSYTLPAKTADNNENLEESAASAWAFLADHVLLKDCRVHLKTPDLDMTLAIEEAELTRLTTRGEQPAGTFTFKGKLNDGPIALHLDTVHLVPELVIGGDISITGFQLKELSRMLRDVMPTLAGEVGIDGKLLFSQGEEKGIVVDYDGSFDLSGEDIGNGDFHTTAKSIGWKGKVHYGGPGKGAQRIEIDGLLATDDLHLQIPASGLVMKESKINLRGKTTITIAENILLENDGSLVLEGVELVLPPYGIAEENISWQGTIQYDSNHQGEGLLVRTDGSLALGEFQVGGGEQTTSFAVGGKMVSWQGTTGFSAKDTANRSILDLNGTLLGGELRTTLAEPQLRLGQGRIEMKTVSTISLGENIDFGGTTSIALEKFTLFAGQNDSPAVSVDRLSVAELEGRGGKTVAVKNLSTEGVKASIFGNFPLNIDIPEIQLVDFLTEDLATFTAKELVLQSPAVIALHNGKELVRLERLTVNTLSFADGAMIGAENIQGENFAFWGVPGDSAKKAAVSFGEATLSKISWSSTSGLQSNILQFDDLVAIVVRNKDGQVNISQQLAEMQQETGPGAEQAEPAAEEGQGHPVKTVAQEESQPAAPIKLEKIIVAGKSAVIFEDYTLKVPFVADLAISQLEVTGLDSSKPEQKTDILLRGKVEDRALFELAGFFLPFQDKPNVDMKVDLKNYPLSSLSAYTIQSVGTSLASGQLQIQTKMVLANDKLDMTNAILLKKLEMKTISPELSAELNNQLPIPLDAALAILRDSERNISLDIPLSGPVDELNVGVSSILITALSKAIVPAASGYLMYALGPYGALAYVGMKVGEKMLVVELPPVVFGPQQFMLTEEHGKYLERIGKILKERPEADIQICPQVGSWEFMTEEEKTAMQGNLIEVNEQKMPELLALGQQRGEAIQSLLENDYGITQNRLLVCDTKILTKRNAVPAVLLQL